MACLVFTLTIGADNKVYELTARTTWRATPLGEPLKRAARVFFHQLVYTFIPQPIPSEMLDLEERIQHALNDLETKKYRLIRQATVAHSIPRITL